MTYLTNTGGVYKLSRVLSIVVMLIGLAVYLFAALTGLQTWNQEFDSINMEAVFEGIAMLLLLPGIAPLLAAFYFFVYLKKPFYNLAGLLVMFPIVFVHFLFSVPAVHSNVYKAVGIGVLELLLVICVIAFFNKFVVKRDQEEEASEI